MYVRLYRRAISTRIVAALLLVFQASCGNDLSSPNPVEDNPTTLPSEILPDAQPTYVETDANNLLELAERVNMVVQPQVISGDLTQGDLDVYDLGPVQAGDRILVTIDADPGMQSAIALLDDQGEILLINDHRNVYLGKQGPFIDIAFRRESQSAFIAFAPTPGFTTSGDYILAASNSPDQPLSETRPDQVLLDFEPAFGIRIGNRTPVDIPAFDAASIDSQLVGFTDELVEEIVRRVRDDFAGYNVRIRSTSEGDEPSDGLSRIHFGTFDEALLGIAETVDEYNSEKGQHAIVFTDTFSAFLRLKPSVAELAQAIANVASHEIGHLEGLVHTDNPLDVMDVTASLRELLLDQNFTTSPLYSAVFPIGRQNSVQYLLDSVGGDPLLMFRKGDDSTPRPARSKSLIAQPRARFASRLSSCSLMPEGCHHSPR